MEIDIDRTLGAALSWALQKCDVEDTDLDDCEWDKKLVSTREQRYQVQLCGPKIRIEAQITLLVSALGVTATTCITRLAKRQSGVDVNPRLWESRILPHIPLPACA